MEISGTWEADDTGGLEGTIEEVFHFDDGEQDERSWIVHKRKRDAETIYTGTADDGDHNLYQFQIKDWIYLLNDAKAMNSSALRKFGIEVGQLTLFFDKDLKVCEIDSSWTR